MDLQSVGTFVRDVGFIPAVCLWLIWRDHKKTDVMIGMMNRMMVLLMVMSKALDLIDERDGKE